MAGSLGTNGPAGRAVGTPGGVGKSVPKKFCDLVMKGGVTSGVVYPTAITELSKEYRFASIGGTSAGAIAAGVAAAAEYARAGGKAEAFAQIEKLPWELGATSADGKHSILFHLFQPQLALQGVFAVATAGLAKSGAGWWLATFWGALTAFPFAAVLGMVPGIFASWVGWSGHTDGLRGVGVVVGIVIAILGMFLGLVVATAWEARQIPQNGWGICSGMTEGFGKSPALVPWLSGYMDRLAGTKAGQPLTFGDLQRRGVNLQIITTNLTAGRPYTMPFGEHTHFYFKGAELRKFFPEYVVSWMESNPGTRSSRDLKGEVQSAGLSVLPDLKDLPVIVAVRMSLSFPFLFCPVPLYGVDFGFGPKTADGKHIPEPSLFVDGGLTSNFPLNLFDKPLPRWPTFGIDLQTQNDGRHFNDIYMACSNGGGLEEWWTRFDEGKGWGGLLSYFSLLFDTSRNWRDNLQMNVPGYRDRVVHIGLDPAEEGGLNLDMGDDVITELAGRGEQAGGAILSRYSPDAENPADPDCVVDLINQKWVRFRSFMELLEDVLLSMENAIGYSGFGEPTYEYLLKESGGLSYPMTGAQRAYGAELLGRLMEVVPVVKKARTTNESFETKAPKPEPDLRVTPHF